MDVEPEMTRELKTFGQVPRYGSAVGRIMVREAGLLNRQRIERLIEADFREALRILLETDYGNYLEGATVASEVDEGLLEFLADEYAFLDDVCAGTRVAEFMHVKYDFHNMRVAFKQKYFMHSDGRMFSSLGGIDTDELLASVEKHRTGYLPGYIEDAVERVAEAVQREDKNPQVVDTLIDRFYLERRLELALMERSKFLVSYTRACVDVSNLRTLLRGRDLGKPMEYYENALAEGGRLGRSTILMLAGESGERLSARLMATRYGRMLSDVLQAGEGRPALTVLDRASDEYLLEKLKISKRVFAGPERIIRYMISRESEVAMIRIILMGELHRLPAAAIEERLSPSYLHGGY